jgi:RHS repeat-associated protein
VAEQAPPTASDATGQADRQKQPDASFRVEAPQLTLPKGGGALRAIAEKFGLNPVTGTGSLTVPMATSAGRGGFGPELSITYDSGAGNGPFGFGWSLPIGGISRKTDKGLPQYVDGDESDVFILSGSEDLVPSLVEAGGQWMRDVVTRAVYGHTYAIHRYRPRVEGLFARIEWWRNTADPRDTFWRSISKDNITTWYGRTPESRIADPTDPSRIFTWQICESYDARGNVTVYRYKGEDSAGVDVTAPHERNRTALTRSAKKYLKHIFYGNRTPYFPDLAQPVPVALPTDWCFQIVFDYGEHSLTNPTPQETDQWACRLDPYSTYRPAFEVRGYRLCRRVMMFHQFADEPDVGVDCLVRSTEFDYSQPSAIPADPYYACLLSVTHTGYRRDGSGGYIASSLPPLELEYSAATIDETVRDVDEATLENLPVGVDGSQYRWADLDGEGLQGILSEQGGAWFYKANLSAANRRLVDGEELTLPRFAPVEVVALQPSGAALRGGRQRLMDLSGDGQLDLVDFDQSMPGFFERRADAWDPFMPFRSLPNVDWNSPNLRFLDLTGDGLPDVLVTENDTFRWRASLGEDGFGREQRVAQPANEEKGPRVLFADGTESMFVADMSGDGLVDLVRIRNGEVCYWPNLGYGRFGAKIVMDGSPRFDREELFDGRRIHLGDIDGTGTSDIMYFSSSGRIDLYFNRSGNGFGTRRTLTRFPSIDSVSSVTVVDLLGSGTACLVWSSPLPGHARRPMRYIDLMGGQKPHLLTRVRNNMGAETVIRYAPSTKFYVADKLAGTPWVTRLPFPVHVVERLETYDFVNRSLFVSRYAYHHGYFDGVEREFRGFGRVDQWDTEQFAALAGNTECPAPVNLDAASHAPPVRTMTWFHTGAFFGEGQISKFLEHEYYAEGDASDEVPGLNDAQREAMLLDDTVLPVTVLRPDGTRLPQDFTGAELLEACRALRGSILRQEVYGLDGTNASDRPYTASERNYTIEALQPRGPNRSGVFFVHPRESVEFQYERALYKVSGQTIADPSAPPPARSVCDPRVMHSFVLEVDPFGDVRRSATVGYGRRYVDPDLAAGDEMSQRSLLATYVENTFTNGVLSLADAYRTPAVAEASSYELLQIAPAATLPDITNLFGFDELGGAIQAAADGGHETPFEDVHPSGLTPGEPYRRLLTRVRTYFRPDDLGAAAGDPRALLPLGTIEPLGLAGSGYQLAFTPALIAQPFQRGGAALLPTPGPVLASTGPDGGGYVDLDGDGRFWIPSGRSFYLATAPASPAELTEARAGFFLPRRFEDPFGTATLVDYDPPHRLLVVRTTDATGNTIAASNDYRVLAPTLVTDANGNQATATFDAAGLMIATAVMGKAGGNVGDLPSGLPLELAPAQTDALHDASDPVALAAPLLGNATTRIVYDINRFFRTRSAAPTDPSQWRPAFSVILARERHLSDLAPGEQSPIRMSFGYSDGFGREIQKKVQAEPGPAVDGGAVVDPRWVGSSWTIYNNKGKAVRQYEPFFSQLAKGHQFEFAPIVGVSSIICYDPVQRAVCTVHPNHTYEKIVFDPWRQASWDVNDTVLQDLPASDPDVGDFFRRLPLAAYSPTWRVQRAGGGLGPEEQATATKTAVHANTPSVAYFDTLGRTFVTVADKGAAGKFATHVEFDLQSNQRSVTDPLGRIVATFDYNMVGQRVRQASMDAGERWILNDVLGKTIRAWDARGHNVRSEFDALRRPVALFVLGTDATRSDPRTLASEVLFDRIVYGEGQPNDQALNLRSRIFQHLDTAGIASNVVTDPETGREIGFDFKGNALGNSRQFVEDYKLLPNWSQPAPPLLPEIRVSTARYDALNRVISAHLPDGSVTHPTYNVAGLLERLEVNLRGAAAVTPFVGNIDYDARGRRTSIDYGSSVSPSASTAYTYDPLTFRLSGVTTTRPGFPAPRRLAQSLSYTFDPTGNITHVTDAAQQTIYFNNRIVEPSSEYAYDPVYRLAWATGREHLGLSGVNVDPPRPSSYDDVPRVRLAHPGDSNAMGVYREEYLYDDAGNLLSLVHAGTDPAHPGWTRSYNYTEASLLETAKFGNRLTSTSLSGSVAVTEPYGYDAHGNTTRMPQVQATSWDFRDQLVMTRRQAVSGSDADGALHQGERTYYMYSAAGERVRKVTESGGGVKTKERFYLGAAEVYREYDAGGHTATERQTLHVKDDKRRVALVETTIGGPSAIRFQFENQVGTACLELDEAGAVITYEEYYPYGSTSYQAGRSTAETSLKRFRYTAKERDEETGLYYHGARYYAPWVGRWLSADPAGLHGGANLYAYCRGNPVSRCDPNGMQDETTTAVGVTVGSGGLTLGPFVVPGRDERVVAFGRGGSGFMDTAERNTRLFAINIQDEITLRRSLSLGQGVPPGFLPNGYFPSGQEPGGWAFRTFQDPARPGGLSPMFSGVMTQEALEGNAAGAVHFDMRGVDLTPPLRPGTQPGLSLDDYHSSSEARQGIAHLGSTQPGERNVTVTIQHEEGVSTIRPDANVVEGDPLPPRLADRVPNIQNRPNPPSGPPPASGDPGGSPGTNTGGSRGGGSGTGSGNRTGTSTGSSGGSSGGGRSSSGGGGFSPRAFGQSALGGIGRVVPGVVEGEAGLMGLAYMAAGNPATVGAVAPLMTAAEALPVAAGVGVVGAGTGHLVRAGLEEAGVDHDTASGIGFGAAIVTGAALGSVIPGVGNVAGAIIGAAVAGAFYLLTL